MLFYHICCNILANPGVNSLTGLAKHSVWHAVKHLAPLPFTVPITDQSKLVLTQRPELTGVVALAWSQRMYDYNNMSFIRDITQHPGIVRSCFDVGGNLGIYSLLMSENPDTQVTTFEPHPQTHSTLSRILEANGRQNVKVIQQPLSDRAQVLHFANKSYDPENRVVTADNSASTLQIHSTTGAAVCEQLGYAPDLMKVDTEGHESEILKGFGPWLDRMKIILIEENLPADAITQMLPSRSFLGPLYINYQTKCFSSQKRWPEDAFYLHKTVLPALKRVGYTIA